MLNDIQLKSKESKQAKSVQDNSSSGSQASSYVVNHALQKEVLAKNKIDKKDIKKFSFKLSFP